MVEDRNIIEGKHVTWVLTGQTAVVRLRYAQYVRFEAYHEMERELNTLTDAGNVKHIVVNFDVLEHFTSRLLGILASLHQKVTARGGSLVVCRLRPEPLRAFRLCRMDAIIKVYPSEEEARQAVGQ